MSKFIDNVEVLQRNVFILTPILVSFYKNLKRQDKNILLAYFVFPLVLNKAAIEHIKQIKSTSSLSRIIHDKDIMSGFEDRFNYYKELTDNCIQYAIDCKYINIEDDLSVTTTENSFRITDPRLADSIALATQLHKIFTLDVINTYYAFGIKEL